ncbi:uncharacterized protein EI90DRAFT_3123201 [Cantharellus anzutake]|uniref:uncharacterized protein n=1 Tax=Cantharellus anzutake TaxID=1750568 RepID=UPI0019071C5B|nr:uncharacterized protein EI90DRAFT_3123201 [Cantharellus anzutake]KAF8332125.1 hypothetical protein EI90DRAFT_3123201 [Cantharellus anzutake]
MNLVFPDSRGLIAEARAKRNGNGNGNGMDSMRPLTVMNGGGCVGGVGVGGVGVGTTATTASANQAAASSLFLEYLASRAHQALEPDQPRVEPIGGGGGGGRRRRWWWWCPIATVPSTKSSRSFPRSQSQPHLHSTYPCPYPYPFSPLSVTSPSPNSDNMSLINNNNNRNNLLNVLHGTTTPITNPSSSLFANNVNVNNGVPSTTSSCLLSTATNPTPSSSTTTTPTTSQVPPRECQSNQLQLQLRRRRRPTKTVLTPDGKSIVNQAVKVEDDERFVCGWESCGGQLACWYASSFVRPHPEFGAHPPIMNTGNIGPIQTQAGDWFYADGNLDGLGTAAQMEKIGVLASVIHAAKTQAAGLDLAGGRSAGVPSAGARLLLAQLVAGILAPAATGPPENMALPYYQAARAQASLGGVPTATAHVAGTSSGPHLPSSVLPSTVSDGGVGPNPKSNNYFLQELLRTSRCYLSQPHLNLISPYVIPPITTTIPTSTVSSSSPFALHTPLHHPSHRSALRHLRTMSVV